MTERSTARPAKKSRTRTPSENALDVARYAADRVSGRDAVIRREFVRSIDGSDPPLAMMLRGGQGGEVRLKLFLSMLFIAVKQPFTTTFPGRAWAELLDLSEPATNGARRVSEAIDWLTRHALIHAEHRAGTQTIVTLLSDDGTGVPYRIPGSVAGQLYIKLPPELWTKGWIARLSGRALAMYLVLADYHALRGRPSQPVWINPARAKELYTLSPETWSRGVEELEQHGLVTTSVQYTKDNPMAALRRRKHYRLRPESLRASPGL